MNKKFTKLIAAFALLVLVALSGKAWATDVTFSYADYKGQGTQSTGSEYTMVKTDVSITNTKFYGNNSYAHFYANGVTTISPESGVTITQIVLTATGTSYNGFQSGGTVTSSVGSISNDGATVTWTGTADADFTISNNKQIRWTSIVVTYTSGGTPPSTTYTVTYDCNGGTSGCPENVTGIEAGTTITLANAPTKTDYDFAGWNDGNNTYDAGDEYTVNGDVTFTAQWTEVVSGDDHWVLTELSDLTTSDVFVIVGTRTDANYGGDYAMSNDKGTNDPPTAVAITVANDEVTSTVAANIQWNISGNASDGYIFYPNGSTTTWLYCTNTNNGVRVGGTNTNKTFGVEGGYLKHSATSRYVGIYNSQDWRCYTGYTTGNIAGQTFAFYKKVTGGAVPPTITAANVDIEYDATSGSIAYTINNEPTPAGTLTAAVVSGGTISNLNLGTPSNGTIAFTCAANDATTTRTATVTLTYTYGDNETVTKDVTITQAEAPLIYTTIPALFAAATSTETSVLVTFNNWVVSGVSTNGKNVFVTDNNGNGFVIYYSTDMSSTFAAGNILSGTAVSCSLKKYNGFAELLNVTVTDLTITSGGTVTVADIAMANLAGVNTGALVHYDNLTCSVTTNSNNTTIYNLSDGTTTLQVYNALYAFGSTLENGKTYNITGVYQQYNNTKEILPRSADDIEEVVSAEPFVTVTPDFINAPSAGEVGTLAITYANIPDLSSFDYYFCDAEGNELEDTDPNYPGGWIYAEINDENDVYSLGYLIDANDGAARTAYFKVYTFVENGNDLDEVYAIVTVNQAQYVIDYAELPFEWSSFDETPTGITNNGVTISGYLKFDTSGDNIILKFNDRPGTLEFNVKGNSGSNGWAGTFKVQTSVDGVSYTDLATYDDLSTTEYQEESFDNLNENVRYIKWVYTEKVSGNVAVNYISLAEYVAPTPTITVESTTISATAEETQGTLNVTYTAIETSLTPSIYWYTDNTGTTTTDKPDWISSAAVNETTLNLDYVIAENNGEARTAYFKVYGLDAEFNDVYSDLVTITQAAAPQQYTLTVEPFENLEIITFVNDEMALEGDGEIQVTEGDNIMLSVVADEGYVMETLMVNGVNHVNDIAGDFTYTFEMPAEAVTISATATEQVAPAGGDYVRITSLDQLTDGSIVVIAARYDEEHTNGYYAMKNATSNKPEGVQFTSTTSGGNEILPASIVDNEDDYYWVVNETENGYTFTNSEGFMIGYNSSTNFATGGSNTEWSIELSTSEGTAMVPDYTGFFITNVNIEARHFALNSSHNFGPYHDNNINNNGYNFCLDFFVQSEASVTETYTLEIDAYDTENEKGWYLIASPLADPVDLSDVGGLTDNTFRLYSFNQSADLEWEYYEGTNNPFSSLVNGKGYLYANSENVTLTFVGTPYAGDIYEVTLNNNSDAEKFGGWNLVGNPFGVTAYIQGNNFSFYTMKQGGAELEANDAFTSIAPMEGVFVYTNEDGATLAFTTNAPDKGANLTLNVGKGRSVIDRAIVNFNEGSTLPKFQLDPNHTKVYIPQDNKDYAVVNAENQGEMPVSFKAEENGTYSLSFSNEEVTFSYLHLIDNMTGADIDLLASPSYSFEARTTDYESRFKLVFATGAATDDSFAFFSDGQLIINNDGQATLQVIDLTGRILSSETINGSCSKSLNAPAGVYMLRLVNGDVKVQKVVVR